MITILVEGASSNGQQRDDVGASVLTAVEYHRGMRSVPVMMSLLLMMPSTLALADGSVTVALSPEGNALATALGSSPAQLAAEIKAKIDKAYQTNDVPGFLRSFTDATAFSQRGLAVDYVSVPSSFIIGFGGNVAAGSNDILEEDRPTAGAAVNLGFMLGANLSGWGLPRWTLFGNGFYNSASSDRLSGNLASAGAHAQVKLIQPARDQGAARAFRWTGVDVTSGIEYTRWSLDANQGLSNDFSIAAGSSSIPMELTSDGEFRLTSNAVTIPIEATTGMRLLGILSVYAGAGIDFTAGNSTVDASLSGEVRTQDASNTDVGTVTITADGDNTASPAALRALLGFQVNLWKLKLFLQGNVSQTPAASLSFGVRLVL